MKKMFKFVIVSLFAMLPFVTFAQQDQPVIIRKGNQGPITVRPCASIERVNDNGAVVYKTDLKRSGTLTIPGSEILYVFKPRKDCPELLTLDREIAAKKYADALKTIAKCEPYKKLGWDANIAYLEGLCCYNLKQKDKAVSAWSRALNIKLSDYAAWKAPEVDKTLSMLAIAAAEVRNKSVVNKVAAHIKGKKSSAQQGILIAEGDILSSENKTREAMFKYLEAALCYKSDELTPRALCMGANALKTLGDSRAAIFSDKLKKEYPGNSWISSLK